MKKINLNLQSNRSLNAYDLTEDILTKFADFDIISITDHNNVKSCYETAHKKALKCINGLEADATGDDYTFDYLCYGFDVKEF